MSAALPAALVADAVVRNLGRATSLFDRIAARTGDGAGMHRAPYSELEQACADILAEEARRLRLDVSTDPFGNLAMTMPGRTRDARGWLVGSHIDSVPRGGNFDGLAGVVAGLTAVAALRDLGYVPEGDVSVLGIRGEEASGWYAGHHGGHIGSRAALGLLPPEELDSAVHQATGRTLREDMRRAGCSPEDVRPGRRTIDLARYKGYLELHIEQGPVLESRGLPVGIVTAIRGAARARSCRCVGAYTHSGAVPTEYRSDAVLAAVEFVHRLEREAHRIVEAGGDLVFTVGKLYTDAALHAITKVPGEACFCLDIRSQHERTLADMIDAARRLAAEVASPRRVRFELGDFSVQPPATMDARFRAWLADAARELGIPHVDIASGAGHDAQDFVQAGLPAAMIFVRNANGSHNAAESMDAADFALGVQILACTLANR